MDPISIALGLAQLAPIVAGWLGGDRAAEKVESVIDAAKKVTGTLTGEAALAKLQADAELVKAFEAEVTERMKLDMQDRTSARALTASLAQTGHKAAWSAPIISLVVSAGFFAMLYVVIMEPIPEGSRETATILLGTLAAGFTQVLNFWLGSSVGSMRKTDIMARAK